MHLSEPVLQILSYVVLIAGALTVIFVRLHAAKRPTSTRKIILPPIGMTTGFLMFLFPAMRIPTLYGMVSFLIGILFSYPLVLTSKMERIDGRVYLKRSPAFIIVLFVLLALRIALHPYIQKYVTIPQTGAVFFLLAYGMLLPWRFIMYSKYKRFIAQEEPSLRPVPDP